MQSSWEMEFAKYLDENGILWEYEPESFKTPYGYYHPDFYLPEFGLYIEVKGYFRDEQSKKKYEYFAAHRKATLVDRVALEACGFKYCLAHPKKGWMIRPGGNT